MRWRHEQKLIHERSNRKKNQLGSFTRKIKPSEKLFANVKAKATFFGKERTRIKLRETRMKDEKERFEHYSQSKLWENHSLLENDLRVLEALRCTGSATRSELVQRCQLPRTTVYDALVRLETKGLVVRYFEPRKTRGRPRTFFMLTMSSIHMKKIRHETNYSFKVSHMP